MYFYKCPSVVLGYFFYLLRPYLEASQCNNEQHFLERRRTEKYIFLEWVYNMKSHNKPCYCDGKYKRQMVNQIKSAGAAITDAERYLNNNF